MKMKLNNVQHSFRLYIIVLIFSFIVLLFGSCGPSSESVGLNTVDVQGTTFVVIKFPSDPVPYEPDWARETDKILIPEKIYTIYDNFMAITTQNFNRQEAISVNDIQKFTTDMKDLGHDSKMNDVINSVMNSAKTQREQNEYNILYPSASIAEFMTMYGDKINAVFFNETDQDKVKTSIKDELSDPDVRNAFLFMNMLFPKHQFSLTPYVASGN
jgi:hypothetical protein